MWSGVQWQAGKQMRVCLCGAAVVPSLLLYLSKQRSTFLPLLSSIAAFMAAPMREGQVDRSRVSPIVLPNLLSLDENQEVPKPFVYN